MDIKMLVMLSSVLFFIYN